MGKRITMIMAGAAAGGVILTGCGSSGTGSNSHLGGSEQSVEQPASESLRPAKEAAPHTDVKLGEKAKLDDSTNITFESADLKTSAETGTNPYLLVKVRVENTGSESAQYPEMGIICANTSDPSDTWAGGQLDTSKPLPARSFGEGTVEVILVGDHFAGDHHTDKCVGPAYLVAVSNSGGFDEPARSVRVALDASLIRNMNEQAAKDNAANDD